MLRAEQRLVARAENGEKTEPRVEADNQMQM